MKIRKFEERDREYIRKICADTAKGNFAVDPDKREAISIAYVDYYMDCEPEHVIVAEEDNKAVGYIVCSLDAEKFQSEFPKYIKKMKQYSPLLAFFQKICLRVNKNMDKKYGGGFHINLDKDYQGGGLGTILMTAMGEHLIKNGVKNMYLVTQNRKTRGYGFYSHYGFHEIKSYPLGSVALSYDLSKLKEEHSLSALKQKKGFDLDL